MKVCLLVANYENKVLGTFSGPNCRKKADAANKALVGTPATVETLTFVSPCEQKKLDKAPAPARR